MPNQVVIEESRVMLKKTKEIDSPLLNTAEFGLLCKLYLSNKNKVLGGKPSFQDLQSSLPLLVSNTVSSSGIEDDLNFQLHFFLASIIINYVNNWYYTKLDTNNFDFVVKLYHVLSHLTKDFVSRLTKLSEKSFTEFIDEVCYILGDHIKKLHGEIYHDVCLSSKSVTVKSIEETFRKRKSLLSKHVVEFFAELSPYSGLSDESSADDLKDSRLEYLRIISKKILIESFTSDSDIKMQFINKGEELNISGIFTEILLSDIVLENIVNKISSPRFLFDSLIQITDSMVGSSNLATNNLGFVSYLYIKISWTFSILYRSLTLFVRLIYTMSLLVKEKSARTYEKDKSINFHNNSIYLLIDSLTDFSRSRPIVKVILQHFRSFILRFPILTEAIDAQVFAFVRSKKEEMVIFKSSFYSQHLNDLRNRLFNEVDLVIGENEYKNEKDDEVFNVSLRLFDILFGNDIEKKKRMPTPSHDVRLKRIYSILLLLNYEITSHDSFKVNEESLLNGLLVIQILERFIFHLYA